MKYYIIKIKHCGSEKCKTDIGKNPFGINVFDRKEAESNVKWYNSSLDCECRVGIENEI